MSEFKKHANALVSIADGTGQLMPLDNRELDVEDLGLFERARARRKVARLKSQFITDELLYVEERRSALRRTRIDNLTEHALAVEGRTHREVMDQLRCEEFEGVAEARLKMSAVVMEVGEKIVDFYDGSKEVVEAATSEFGRDYLASLRQQEIEANIKLNDWQREEADNAHRQSAGRHILNKG